MEGLVEATDFYESKYFSEGWKYGPPRGIMFHFTENDRFRAGNIEKLGASVHFSVFQDPKSSPTVQYVSLLNRSWHAFEASDYYFGLEHMVDLDNVDFSVEQLEESARISAEIVKFSKDKWGVSLPLVRAPGSSFTPGFKDHKDGLGSSWNVSFHKDGLVKNWTWNKYIAKVSYLLEDDDMALFESKEDFRTETLKALVGENKQGDPMLSQDDMLDSLRMNLGMAMRMKGEQRPEKSDASQKGWDFADRIMQIEVEAGKVNIPKGKISGILTWEG